MRGTGVGERGRECDLDWDLGDIERRGECEWSGAGEGARLKEVGVWERVRERPRDGERDGMLSYRGSNVYEGNENIQVSGL